MRERGDLLRQVMQETGTSQAVLARRSGVHQPSLSQFLSGRTNLSDDKLAMLLACMGYQLEVVRRPVRPELTRSELRSWRLHVELVAGLTPEAFDQWGPRILRRLQQLRAATSGQPHRRNLERWERLVRQRDAAAIRKVSTGLDRDSIEMREVSPLGGLLEQTARDRVLAELRDAS